jgi:hypothetical protein
VSNGCGWIEHGQVGKTKDFCISYRLWLFRAVRCLDVDLGSSARAALHYTISEYPRALLVWEDLCFLGQDHRSSFDMGTT